MKWISVEESNPEANTYVLAFDGKKVKECFYTGTYWQNSSCWDFKAIYWMPLPLPPNEEKKEVKMEKDPLEYSVTEVLPDNGERVLAWGNKTFCCVCDMEKEKKWHEVVFSLDIVAYKLKKEIPSDPEETILQMYECRENWCIGDHEDSLWHVIGVTKWKNQA